MKPIAGYGKSIILLLLLAKCDSFAPVCHRRRHAFTLLHASNVSTNCVSWYPQWWGGKWREGIPVPWYLVVSAWGKRSLVAQGSSSHNSAFMTTLIHGCAVVLRMIHGIMLTHDTRYYATPVKNLIFLARLKFSWKTGCIPPYFQYKEVTFLFSSQNLAPWGVY